MLSKVNYRINAWTRNIFGGISVEKREERNGRKGRKGRKVAKKRNVVQRESLKLWSGREICRILISVISYNGRW